MAANSRIDDLRRRVEQDPASIAFAQLAEEYRRVGQFRYAVTTCRAGLALHPSYLSARVTLGRSLLALEHLDEAEAELGIVLATAPDNLAATRALAEVYRLQGRRADAVACYSAALTLAPNDPDLERQVQELAALPPLPPAPDPAQLRATATLATLEGWLEALDAARADRDA